METSYLKAHPFENRYLEWMPNLTSDIALLEGVYLPEGKRDKRHHIYVRSSSHPACNSTIFISRRPCSVNSYLI